MSMPRSLLLCGVLLFACIGSPAIAWEDENGDWLATHHAIYELENLIAFLEADPQTDDGYKAPIITKARAEIRRLQASARPAAMALDDAVLLQPQADLHSLSARLAGRAARTLTPPARRAERRSGAGTAAAACVRTIR